MPSNSVKVLVTFAIMAVVLLVVVTSRDRSAPEPPPRELRKTTEKKLSTQKKVEAWVLCKHVISQKSPVVLAYPSIVPQAVSGSERKTVVEGTASFRGRKVDFRCSMRKGRAMVGVLKMRR